jgi:acyl-CoA synthetase (AMP-forming)/AMP-acid ligase II
MLGGLVAGAARAYGDAPALVGPDGEVVTYAALHERTDAVAQGLRARGVKPGGVVALTLSSTPEYVLAYLGAAKAGLITCGVNPRLSDAQRTAALDIVQPDLVIDAEAPRAHGAPDALDADPERPVAIVLTSGTTGEPKGALFRERQLAAIDAIDTAGHTAPAGTPLLASTEFAHIGVTTKLWWHLRLGMRIHMLGSWRAAAALDIIERERMPSVGGIAAQIALMLREPDFDERDLSAVRLVVAGGAPSSPGLIAEARARFGADYSVRYSSTESGGLGTVGVNETDNVGRPRPGVEIDIRDGEVWLRSPAVMSGYRRDPEATAEVLRDGWLRTGDLGWLDEQGRLHLTGRATEMYIRGGYNVYPVAVEVVLATHPNVADVAVTPRADDVMGEIGVAVVVPADPARAPTLQDLRTFASDRLAQHELPEDIRIVEELPLNAMHKLDRRALADDIDERPGEP